MTSMVAGRAITALAAAAMLIAVVLNVLPTTATTYEGNGPTRLSCGTLLVPTDDRFADSCEDPRTVRVVASMAAWLAGLALGTVGLTVLGRAVRTTR